MRLRTSRVPASTYPEPFSENKPASLTRPMHNPKRRELNTVCFSQSGMIRTSASTQTMSTRSLMPERIISSSAALMQVCAPTATSLASFISGAKSKHSTFKPRNVSSLFNSFSETRKGNLPELPRQTEALHDLLDVAVGLTWIEKSSASLDVGHYSLDVRLYFVFWKIRGEMMVKRHETCSFQPGQREASASVANRNLTLI